MFSKFASPAIFFDADDKGGGASDPKTDDQSSAGDGKGSAAGGQADKKEFTQDELNKLFGDTRKQGRESLQKELLEKAGFNSLEDLLAATAAHKKSEEEKLSEIEKAKKVADDAKAEKK